MGKSRLQPAVQCQTTSPATKNNVTKNACSGQWSAFATPLRRNTRPSRACPSEPAAAPSQSFSTFSTLPVFASTMIVSGASLALSLLKLMFQVACRSFGAAAVPIITV